MVNFAKMKDLSMSMNDNETVIVCTRNKIKRKKGRGGVSIFIQPEKRPTWYLF
jgi:hypothetical protein